MLRFTKGCKDTNVAGPLLSAAPALLELRFPSKTAENPTKSRDTAFARLGICASPETFILSPFCFFQGGAPSRSSTSPRLDTTIGAHIVDATHSMYGRVVSPFL